MSVDLQASFKAFDLTYDINIFASLKAFDLTNNNINIFAGSDRIQVLLYFRISNMNVL